MFLAFIRLIALLNTSDASFACNEIFMSFFLSFIWNKFTGILLFGFSGIGDFFIHDSDFVDELIGVRDAVLAYGVNLVWRLLFKYLFLPTGLFSIKLSVISSETHLSYTSKLDYMAN